MLYKEIADTLSISRETVKKHLKNIYQKLHVQNKVEALNKYRLL
jgi:two-component system, NarL family, response regulator LiaR